MTYCEHDDYELSCPVCQNIKDDQFNPGDIGPLFKARHSSECPSCGGKVVRGQMVRMCDAYATHEGCVA